MKIEGINTETGNKILDQLKGDGWKVTGQYSRFAIDKGIDFDSYTLVKGTEILRFEWTNWFEWEIEGNESVISQLTTTHGLKSTYRRA